MEKEIRALKNYLFRRELNKEERGLIKTVDNAAILPLEFSNKLQEIKKGYGSLQEYCDVIPVKKSKGRIPVVDYSQNEDYKELIVEGEAFPDADLVTSDIEYSCDKTGMLFTVSEELYEDSEVKINNITENNFTEIAVIKENKKILNAINLKAKINEGENYEKLIEIMDSNPPLLRKGLITLCNIEGYKYLKSMKDSSGKNLGLITSGVDGREYFNNKEIIVFDDSLITLSEGKTKLYYSLNMKEAIKFIKKKGVKISSIPGFSNDTIKVKLIEEFDVVNGSSRAINKLELD
ncbi:phage major capsid protein [Clostridium saudiense]|uniref:phage major capsid protein n=1 Tax=Clostridium saudiense TaxID=1414720 RepID=UPI0018A98364|nr:phage major capsid protein [Clostridium saudiense]